MWSVLPTLNHLSLLIVSIYNESNEVNNQLQTFIESNYGGSIYIITRTSNKYLHLFFIYSSLLLSNQLNANKQCNEITTVTPLQSTEFIVPLAASLGKLPISDDEVNICMSCNKV
ncbi:unnamed protein product [Adineta steineri]|uniref:Uncharacterized protein n=1 Tax=Adineta steineri TaxID=433720 RepID=A0A819N2Q1_9BILA|nr:unnamed protein product [Adineta steineri]CAF3987541.1 unnamed protein product [Adineta steineri]